jgi:hypothetical protein
MRSIEGNLTEEIKRAIGSERVVAANAFSVKTYRELVEHVAKLAYLNKDHLLFFRGQTMDYRNKAGASTFYPSIYRGDYVPRHEVRYRFDVLQGASRLLADEFTKRNLPGAPELRRKKYIQWGILQHYEVCDTPLLDITHSLRVAGSFATNGNEGEYGYVFVFGLPYLTNRISVNSEHDLVNIRLLSICPPNALRPYYQDGYVAGTEDVHDEYENKSELDFNNRLIAKFRIENSSKFWGKHFPSVPHEALYPRKDEVLDLCQIVKQDADRDLQSGTIGDFLKQWTELEQLLLERTRNERDRPTVRDAMKTMLKLGVINEEIASSLDHVRRFRNEVVHRPQKVRSSEIGKYQSIVASTLESLRGEAGEITGVGESSLSNADKLK